MTLYSVPVLTLCIFICICYIQLCRLRFFELQLKFLFILNLVSGLLKLLDLPSMIISHILHRLFLHLVTPCVVFFQNEEEASILLRFLCCLWLLIIFVEV